MHTLNLSSNLINFLCPVAHFQKLFAEKKTILLLATRGVVSQLLIKNSLHFSTSGPPYVFSVVTLFLYFVFILAGNYFLIMYNSSSDASV